MGDSILWGAAGFLTQNNKQNIATKVIPGAKIEDCSRYLNSLKNLPQKIILNIGSNNIPSSKTPNQTLRLLWYTIEAGIKYSPNTRWYVNIIPYRRDIRYKIIEDTNEALRFMCQNLKITYIDITSVLADSDMAKVGIHPNEQSAEKIAKQIINLAELEEPQQDIAAQPNTCKHHSANTEPPTPTENPTHRA
jgi:hypothetical protein